MKYRKKPIVVEAVRWTGKNQTEIDKFCGMKVVWSENKKCFLVLTLEGMLMYGREAQSKTWIASPATIPKSGERNRKIHSCMLYLISI